MNEQDRTADCKVLAKEFVDWRLNGAELMIINNALIDMYENEGRLERFGCSACVARVEPLIQRVLDALEHLEEHTK